MRFQNMANKNAIKSSQKYFLSQFSV